MIIKSLYFTIQLINKILFNILDLVYKASLITSQWKLNFKSFIFILLPLILLVLLFNNFHDFISCFEKNTQYYIFNLVSLYSCYILSLIIIRCYYLIINSTNFYTLDTLLKKDNNILFIYLTYLGITIFFTSLSLFLLTRIYFSFYTISPEFINFYLNYVIIFSSLFSLFYIGFNIDSKHNYDVLFNKQTNIIIAIITLLMITSPAWIGYIANLFVNSSMNKYLNLDKSKVNNSNDFFIDNDNYFITLLNRIKFNIWRYLSVECSAPEENDKDFSKFNKGKGRDKPFISQENAGSNTFNYSNITYSNNDSGQPSVTQTSTPSSPRPNPQIGTFESYEFSNRRPNPESSRGTTNNEGNKTNLDNSTTTVNFHLDNSNHYHYHATPYSKQSTVHNNLPYKYNSLKHFNSNVETNPNNLEILNRDKISQPRNLNLNPNTFFNDNTEVILPIDSNNSNLTSNESSNVSLLGKRRIDETLLDSTENYESLTKRAKVAKTFLDRSLNKFDNTISNLQNTDNTISLENNNLNYIDIEEGLNFSISPWYKKNSVSFPLMKEIYYSLNGIAGQVEKSSSDNLFKYLLNTMKSSMSRFKQSQIENLPLLVSNLDISDIPEELKILKDNPSRPTFLFDPEFKNSETGKLFYDSLIKLNEEDKMTITFILNNAINIQSFWSNMGFYNFLFNSGNLSSNSFYNLVQNLCGQALIQNKELNDGLWYKISLDKKYINVIVFFNGFYSYFNEQYTEYFIESYSDTEFTAIIDREILNRTRNLIFDISNAYYNLVLEYNFLFEEEDMKNILILRKIIITSLNSIHSVIINETNVTNIINSILLYYNISPNQINTIEYNQIKTLLLTSNNLSYEKKLVEIIGVINKIKPDNNNHKNRLDLLESLVTYFNKKSENFIIILPTSIEKTIRLLQENSFLSNKFKDSIDLLNNLFYLDFTSVAKNIDFITYIRNALNNNRAYLTNNLELPNKLTMYYEKHKLLNEKNELFFLSSENTIKGFLRVFKNSLLLGSHRHNNFTLSQTISSETTLSNGILNPNVTYDQMLLNNKGSFFQVLNSEGISVYVLLILEEKNLNVNSSNSNNSIESISTNLTPLEFWCDSKEKLELILHRKKLIYLGKVDNFVQKHYKGIKDKNFFDLFNKDLNLSMFKTWIIINSKLHEDSFRKDGLALIKEGTNLVYMNNAVKNDIPVYFKK